MVSYRFKRDGQYIQRELELDPLAEHQDQVYPESLEEQVDYSAFYDTYYDGFDEDSISREQEEKTRSHCAWERKVIQCQGGCDRLL